MKLFSEFDNTSDSFPDTLAVDSSGPTLRDGTAITSDVVNDIWGFFQALLFESDQTPNTDSEYAERGTGGVSGSQAVRAVRALGGAPGEIVYFAGSIDGDGLPDTSLTPTRLIEMAGQIVPIASYPHLVTATYIGDANNADTDHTGFYKCTVEGTRSTSGTYFKIPDCRGYFVRALNGTSNNDVGRDVNGIGSKICTVQASALGHHQHYIGDANSMATTPTKASEFSMVPTLETLTTGSGGVARSIYTNAGGTNSTTDLVTGFPAGEVSDVDGEYDEVRPVNIAFYLMIRY